MRDKKQILRSSCMSCDCVEYKRRNNNRCAQCNCLDTSHYKVDEMIGSFHTPSMEIDKGAERSSWFRHQSKNQDHFQWFSIHGVESITLIIAQQQVCLGALGLATLFLVGLLLPFQTGLYWGSLLSLRINTCLVFATSAFMAYRAYKITKLTSKQVTCASLIFLNAYLSISYLLMGIGIFPRLRLSGMVLVEPARYIVWLVVLPLLCHISGDITSNKKDMTWFSRLSYAVIISMFFSQLFPNNTIYASSELITMTFMIYGLNRIFKQVSDSERMMDNTATILSQIMVCFGLCMIQITWILETSNFIGFTTGELCKSIADIFLISGLTISIAFADMKELEAF